MSRHTANSNLTPDQMRRMADYLRRQSEKMTSLALARATRKRAAEWEDQATINEMRAGRTKPFAAAARNSETPE